MTNSIKFSFLQDCVFNLRVKGKTIEQVTSNYNAIIFFFQYCPIPVISYPQLEYELFCNIYYLRHLCDTQRFPDWPIKEPVC